MTSPIGEAEPRIGRTSSTNPWFQNSRIYSSFGGLRELLKVEKKFGLVESLSISSEKTLKSDGDDSTSVFFHAGRYSLDKINAMLQLSKLRDEERRLQTQIRLTKMREETSDVMDVRSIESLIRMLEEYSTLLGDIIERKHIILEALQQDTTGCLVLRTENQAQLTEIIPIVAQELGDCTVHLENLKWAVSLSKRLKGIRNDYSLLMAYVDHLKQYYSAINAVRDLMLRRTRKHLQNPS